MAFKSLAFDNKRFPTPILFYYTCTIYPIHSQELKTHVHSAKSCSASSQNDISSMSPIGFMGLMGPIGPMGHMKDFTEFEYDRNRLDFELFILVHERVRVFDRIGLLENVCFKNNPVPLLRDIGFRRPFY